MILKTLHVVADSLCTIFLYSLVNCGPNGYFDRPHLPFMSVYYDNIIILIIDNIITILVIVNLLLCLVCKLNGFISLCVQEKNVVTRFGTVQVSGILGILEHSPL